MLAFPFQNIALDQAMMYFCPVQAVSTQHMHISVKAYIRKLQSLIRRQTMIF